MLAIVDAYRQGLLGRSHWLPNVISGVTVGVVALPLAMAFAIASGAKPEQGIYTAIVAGFIVSAAGGSRLQIAGPTGAFIVILSGITATHGIEGLQIATLMAGVMVLLLGLARLGSIIKFIPAPVIVGFTAGIGLIIFVGQWKDFFGLPAPAGAHFHEQLPELLAALPGLHPATTALAAASLLVVVFASRVPGLKRIPGPLAALLFATGLQSVFAFEGVATIGTAFGGVPSGLPAVGVPDVTAAKVIELMGPAFTIAMLCAIESLLSAVVADGMAGTRHDSNQELVGQGLANIATPFFGGFAATGAIARTATNVRNGGTSPLAGIVHAATLVLVILFLAPLAVNVPLAALAAILFVVAWNMSEVRHVVHMVRRAPRADVAILLVTFGLTVFVDLVVAVNIGVILATLHFLRRMAASVEVQQVGAEELQDELTARGAGPLPPDVLVYKVEGPFFFGAVENFERALAFTHTDPRVLIIRLRWVPFMDITGVQALEEAIQDLQRRGVRVMITGANPRVAAKLEKAGVIALIGRENFCENIVEALARI
ncbi:MAG: SulP family inorganic anion transporter [Steroidobacteraceae bacterium]|jgi:SulP family sulfate permease|nr:SulP family inorganic anion transporter [Steroidobacteraceae bacterium]